MNREQAQVATLDQLYTFGYNRIVSIARNNSEPLTAGELMETEEIERSFSPNEEWIAGINDREDAEDAWNALDEGIGSAVEDYAIEEDKVLSPEDVEDMTREMLNEAHPCFTVGSLTYPAGDTLEQIDPVAFREEVLAYADSLESDGYRIEN